jgi:uncharacterized phiE125 gp8 family phage protein
MHEGEYSVAVPPSEEPITLAEAKTHLRVDHDDDDMLITGYIAAARQTCELTARRAFVTQTLELHLEEWPCDDLDLPMPPLQSVTSITYIDVDGVTHTVSASDYIVYASLQPGEIHLKWNAAWPSVQLQPGPSITVRYVAGYGLAVAVPWQFKSAVLLLVGHFYENREAVVVGTIATVLPMAVKSLLMIDRRSWF